MTYKHLTSPNSGRACPKNKFLSQNWYYPWQGQKSRSYSGSRIHSKWCEWRSMMISALVTNLFLCSVCRGSVNNSITTLRWQQLGREMDVTFARQTKEKSAVAYCNRVAFKTEFGNCFQDRFCWIRVTYLISKCWKVIYHPWVWEWRDPVCMYGWRSNLSRKQRGGNFVNTNHIRAAARRVGWGWGGWESRVEAFERRGENRTHKGRLKKAEGAREREREYKDK